MREKRIDIRVMAVILVILRSATGGANEVSWVGETACPRTWSIEPERPTDMDVLLYSGPTGTYLNRCFAERQLGGKPTLHVDHDHQTVELRFEPPASNDCVDFWKPVCGLRGTFGPLAPGQWLFFSNAGTTFSIPFEVGGGTPGPRIHYVDAHAAGANNGLSWTDAFVYLQSALAVAVEGSEIRVAQGTYRPDQGPLFDRWDQNATFRLMNGVTLKGGYAGSAGPNPNERDVVLYESILSGDLYEDDEMLARPYDMIEHPSRSDNCYHVVTAIGVDATAVLDGFTITGGVAKGSHMPDRLSCGGGLYNDAGSPTIRDCRVTGNAAAYYGGGLYNRSLSAPRLISCTIDGNRAVWWGGGVYNDWGSDLVMSRCIVSGNGVRFQGGGICCRTDGRLAVANSIVSGNMATESTYGRGGGVYSFLAQLDLNHCTFVGNTAAAGSALACDSTDLEDKSEIRVANSILWDDGQTVWNGDDSILEIAYSDVLGGWPGEGNIDADPYFVLMGYWDYQGTPADPCDDVWYDGDYQLLWDSPCVDGGDPEVVPDPSETDLAGRARLSGLVVDMGAYELRNDPPVADAGSTATGFTLDGISGNVTLDASGSYDPEGLPLTYGWYYEDQLVSQEMRFTIELALGEHVLTLVVRDSAGVSAADEVIATVLEVIEATTLVSPRQIDRGNTHKPIHALVILPDGMRPEDFDLNEPMLLFPGGVEAVHQVAFYWLNGQTFVLTSFDRAEVMKAIPDDQSVELRVVGRLISGRYFSGADTVTIK